MLDFNNLPNLWEIILLERQTSILISTKHSLYSVSHAECKQQVCWFNYKKLTKINLISIIFLQVLGFNDTNSSNDINITNSIHQMTISADNKHIALLSKNNQIWIGSSDLRKVFRIYKKPFTSPIDQMAWYLLFIIMQFYYIV